jgi:hypothetical protein
MVAERNVEGFSFKIVSVVLEHVVPITKVIAVLDVVSPAGEKITLRVPFNESDDIVFRHFVHYGKVNIDNKEDKKLFAEEVLGSVSFIYGGEIAGGYVFAKKHVCVFYLGGSLLVSFNKKARKNYWDFWKYYSTFSFC